jgi:hypothetical protein
LDLTHLRQPEQANALVDIVAHADLDSSTLRAIRDAAAARLPSGEGTIDLSKLRATQKAELYVAMAERVFGTSAPSVAGFRNFLNRLAKQDETTYDQKKEICRAVNFWKAHLNVDLFYNGAACNLSSKTSGGIRGGYMLRAVGQKTVLYAAKSFPPLAVRART